MCLLLRFSSSARCSGACEICCARSRVEGATLVPCLTNAERIAIFGEDIQQTASALNAQVLRLTSSRALLEEACFVRTCALERRLDTQDHNRRFPTHIICDRSQCEGIFTNYCAFGPTPGCIMSTHSRESGTAGGAISPSLTRMNSRSRTMAMGIIFFFSVD